MLKKILCILMVLLLLVGCQPQSEDQAQPISESTFMLGTVISVTLYESVEDSFFDDLFETVSRVEEKMSRTISSSEVSRMNDLAMSDDYDQDILIDEEVYFVIEKALEYGEKSKGKFDITMAPIVDLWAIGTEGERIPGQSEINDALRYTGLERIKLSGPNKINLAENTQIDLGGIAKGYAADVISDYLKKKNINKAIINLGGNVKVIGEKARNTPFKVGIQDPLNDRNNYLGIISLSDKTIVTSGDYERYFEVGDRRYHHIFDPETGYPYETNVASVTVISDDSIDADALSTILYLMEVEEGIEFVNSLEGIECIYVTKDRKVYLSSQAIRDKFELTEASYNLNY